MPVHVLMTERYDQTFKVTSLIIFFKSQRRLWLTLGADAYTVDSLVTN